jgi:two-component system response regulator RegX3
VAQVNSYDNRLSSLTFFSINAILWRKWGDFMDYNCLIIDDEEALAEATAEYFNAFGVRTAYVTDGSACRTFLKNNHVDLFLLDINLRKESGFFLCEELRKQYNSPILFISARQSDDDILKALNIGGDDYIKKPYTLSVLLAKVNAVRKRYINSKNGEMQEAGGFLIDPSAMRVSLNGMDLKLKTMEFKLFYYLFKNKGKVVTKDQLFFNVWGDGFYSDGTLNVHIRRLREKIEEDPNSPRIIKTIWGVGYIMEL